MTEYQQKIMEAFEAVSAANGGLGASAHEVCVEMTKRKTISPLDSVIDIADQMADMAEAGYFAQARGSGAV